MRRTLLFSAFLLTATLSTWADEDFILKGGLNLGFRTLEFQQTFIQGVLTDGTSSTNPAWRSADFSQTFRSLDVSAAMSWKAFYVTANYETSLDNGEAVVSNTFTDLTNGDTSSIDHPFDFNREDYAINLGWNPADNFSLFIGYKYGETSTERTTELGLVGAPNGKLKSTFEESGPFVGISYNWIFKEGILTFSVANAHMTGKYDESGDEIVSSQTFGNGGNVIVTIVQHAMVYKGDTNALSANLSWNLLSGEHYAYYFGFRWQHYDFDASADLDWDFRRTTPGNPLSITPLKGTADINNEETMTAFYAGVNYLF